jgi:hypothetical protein
LPDKGLEEASTPRSRLAIAVVRRPPSRCSPPLGNSSQGGAVQCAAARCRAGQGGLLPAATAHRPNPSRIAPSGPQPAAPPHAVAGTPHCWQPGEQHWAAGRPSARGRSAQGCALGAATLEASIPGTGNRRQRQLARCSTAPQWPMEWQASEVRGAAPQTACAPRRGQRNS